MARVQKRADAIAKLDAQRRREERNDKVKHYIEVKMAKGHSRENATRMAKELIDGQQMAHSLEKLNPYSLDGLKKLRTAVKIRYMKDYPKDFMTDYEADKVLETLSPVTLDQLYKMVTNKKVVTEDGIIKL